MKTDYEACLAYLTNITANKKILHLVILTNIIKKQWDPIKRFNTAALLCLFQEGT